MDRAANCRYDRSQVNVSMMKPKSPTVGKEFKPVYGKGRGYMRRIGRLSSKHDFLEEPRGTKLGGVSQDRGVSGET